MREELVLAVLERLGEMHPEERRALRDRLAEEDDCGMERGRGAA